MIFPKSVRHFHFRALFQIQNPSSRPQNPLQNHHVLTSSIRHEFGIFHPILCVPFSFSAHFKPRGSEPPKKKSQESLKPLSVYFKECVGMSEPTEISGSESPCEAEKAEVVGKLKTLEEEVKSLSKEKGRRDQDALKLNFEKGDGKPIPLWALFADASVKKEINLVEQVDDSRNHRGLSLDMQTLAHHLYNEGYLKDANLMHKYNFDVALFEDGYGRGFLRFAALKFAKDHHEIAKWLSASDLKELALFGCPCLESKTVFAAKALRKFFEIPEHEVCQKCTIRKSCKHESQIFRKHIDNLHLHVAMRVLIAYAMELSPQDLVVPEKIKNCATRLLKETISLSRIVS
ncbi:uncharacterized protein [Primulina eburnea]|uniref:uncharacterized protein isoform X1 n=1 Tax=Primulina eburnea TaxID=1245227 RepID=UPI003C6C03AD